MEKGTIMSISIADFKQYEKFDYIDDDIIVVTDLEDIPHGKSMKLIRVNFFLIVICQEGYIQLDVNGKTYLLEKDDSIICLPTMILSRAMFSPGHKMTMMGFSIQFMQRTLKWEKDAANMMKAIFKNPIRHIDRENQSPDFCHYGELLLAKFKNPHQHYHKNIIQHLFSALFFEMFSDIRQYQFSGAEEEDASNRATQIFRQFMKELSRDNGQHRSVNYFADRLCYSPKYVSCVIKQVSGRTALDWINEYAIEQIKHELKYSEKSVKEIAEQFNFPNQSFFGKYVKAHLGTSPAKYRESAD